MIPETQTASTRSHFQPKPFWQRLVYASLGVHLAIVLLLAGGLRAACFLVSNQDPVARQMEEDSYGYLALGSNLAEGKGFGRFRPWGPGAADVWVPELCRTPGYPAIIALLDLATGHPRTVTILLQHSLGLVLCAAATIVCRRLFGAPAGLLAGSLLALDAQGIALSNLLLAENIFAFLLFAAALVAARLLVQPSPLVAVAAGALLGTSTLVRPTSVALAGLMAACLLVRALVQHQRRGVLAVICLVLTSSAIVVGWTLRNGVVCGEYTLSSISRDVLLNWHAGGALARHEGISRKAAAQLLADTAGVNAVQIRPLPLSAEENARVRRVALDTLWRCRSAFLADAAVHTTNMLFGPDKNALITWGLPTVRWGIIEKEKTAAGAVPVASWLLLSSQVALLGITYPMVLGTGYRMLRGVRVPALVWMCLIFVAYLLMVSWGSPGDPRYRWPAIPLLTVIAAACLRNETQAGRPLSMAEV